MIEFPMSVELSGLSGDVDTNFPENYWALNDRIPGNNKILAQTVESETKTHNFIVKLVLI